MSHRGERRLYISAAEESSERPLRSDTTGGPEDAFLRTCRAVATGARTYLGSNPLSGTACQPTHHVLRLQTSQTCSQYTQDTHLMMLRWHKLSRSPTVYRGSLVSRATHIGSSRRPFCGRMTRPESALVQPFRTEEGIQVILGHALLRDEGLTAIQDIWKCLAEQWLPQLCLIEHCTSARVTVSVSSRSS